MSKEIETRISGLISELEKGIEFGKDQAPIIVEQLLNYEMFFASVWLLFAVIITISAYIGLYKYTHWEPIDKNIPMALISILTLITIIANGMNIVKILIAPNLYVLDYLRYISQ